MTDGIKRCDNAQLNYANIIFLKNDNDNFIVFIHHAVSEILFCSFILSYEPPQTQKHRYQL